jgi:hypothetical protein
MHLFLIQIQKTLLSLERWVAKLVARLFATAVIMVRIRIPPKNTKWAT